MVLAQKVFVQCEHKMKSDQKIFVVGKNIEPKYFGCTKIKQQKNMKIKNQQYFVSPKNIYGI